MKLAMIIGFLVWVLICGSVWTSLNAADQYRDRGASAIKIELATKTVNGDSLDYANLQSVKEAESSSNLIIVAAKLMTIVIFVGGSCFIVRPMFTSKKEEKIMEGNMK